MADKLSKLFATFFYVGYFPVASGTAGSAIGLLLYVLLRNNVWLYSLVTILITGLGFLVSSRAERVFGRHDPGEIVIDEVAGILIALFLFPFKFPLAILAFFIFRGLDMVKPPPADRLEKLPGSLGIMLDDIVAGVYTFLVFQIVFRSISFIIS
ncbi:MAG: phosphatidylglycerophosphatase A [Candidatus Omnitrophota bacterium]|nr:phosphatidylglycerophosphatase A [Candidatus Omnitrophota bacterium]